MAANKAFSTKARESVLAGVVGSHITDGATLLNAIEFIESPMGLGVELYPVQRVLVKLIFGVPMDFKEKMVPVHDVYGEELLYTFKESEYIKWVYEQGRLNIPDWRDADPGGYNETCVLVGRRGGKAFDLNEPIPTPDRGFVPIGELKAGDCVFGPDGLPVLVKEAWEPFEDLVYRVSFDDGSSVLAHGDHQWFTQTKAERKSSRGRKKPEDLKRPPRAQTNPAPEGAVRTTREIMNSLKMVSPTTGRWEYNHWVKNPNPVELPEQNLPLDPYFLGLWLGDGCRGTTSITTMDPEVVDYLHSYAESLGLQVSASQKHSPNKASDYTLHAHRGSKKGEWGNRSQSNVIQNALRDLGIWEEKSIPNQYLWASKEQRLALLQGLMDSDGCCCKRRCEFGNTNQNISDGVFHLLSSLGIKSHRRKRVGKNGVASWVIVWTNPYPVFRLSRKLQELPQEVRPVQKARVITDVAPVGTRTVRCICVDREDGLFLFGNNFNVTHNSQVVSAIAAYKLYLLLSIRSPQEYYKLVPGSPIDFTLMGQDELGASRLYDKLKEDVLRSPFFTTYLRTSTSQKMSFVTEADRNKRDATPTLSAAAYACTTNAVRGPSSYLLALDEFAFYRSSAGTNSDAIYAAATPATLQFANPETQKKDSMVLIISSPLKKVGKYYEVFKFGLENGPKCGTLAFRCSTAEMNPRTPKGSLRAEEKKSPLSFRYEFGGEFADSTESFVKSKQLEACVDEDRQNVTHFNYDLIGHKYFWAFDLGMRHDASALAVGHWEFRDGKPSLIYDYVDRLMVGEGEYEGAEELRLEHIIQWLDRVQKILPCFKGITDQHGGTMLVQLLKAYGIEGMELIHLSPSTNSKMYHAFKGLIDQGAARFPNHPALVNEIKNLEAEVISKYQIRVAAPEEKGSHDDMADACALVAMLAVDWAQGEGAREMVDIIHAPGLVKQGALGAPLISVDYQYASLTDLRLLSKQSQISKTMLHGAMGTPTMPSKYKMVRKGNR